MIIPSLPRLTSDVKFKGSIFLLKKIVISLTNPVSQSSFPKCPFCHLHIVLQSVHLSTTTLLIILQNTFEEVKVVGPKWRHNINDRINGSSICKGVRLRMKKPGIWDGAILNLKYSTSKCTVIDFFQSTFLISNHCPIFTSACLTNSDFGITSKRKSRMGNYLKCPNLGDTEFFSYLTN